MKFITILAVTIISISNLAYADWIQTGIASRCDQVNGTFELAAVVDLNSDDPAAVPVKDGFTRLDYGSHALSCKLSDTKIDVKVRVFGADGGECMGTGYVDIEDLNVQGKAVIPRGRKPFNFNCPTNPILTNIVVHKKSKELNLKICHAEKWGWDKGFSGVTCDEQVLR